jgi:hypothetical protein
MDPRIRLGLVLLVVVMIAEGRTVLWNIFRPTHGVEGVSSVVGLLLVLVFLVGLAARGWARLVTRGPEAARRRAIEARRERLSPRRLAEGVPLDHEESIPEDPDPPLSWDERP